ncbi:MAG TPA: MotA/TolQ/ExbB proton channel family protein [Noviherbaspirillum sp.]|nr:MotA/TolQ/ExbB proton channel family protein [Noviherbaspirillum sp.]
MNPSTILGLILAVLIVAVSAMFSVRHPSDLFDLPSLILVVGGTMAATLISYPLREVVRVFKVFVIVLRNEQLYAREDLNEIVRVSRKYFQGDIATLNQELVHCKNPFLRTGVQLVIDGAPVADIVELLQWRISKLKARETAEAQIFRSMAMYAPAFGMLGTLLGLTNLLHGLQSDFQSIGASLALAMITTLYGILLANLLFKPIAIKFERRTERRVMQMNMVLEGVTLMAQRRSPSFIRLYLESLEERHEDEIRQTGTKVDTAAGPSGK